MNNPVITKENYPELFNLNLLNYRKEDYLNQTRTSESYYHQFIVEFKKSDFNENFNMSFEEYNDYIVGYWLTNEHVRHIIDDSLIDGGITSLSRKIPVTIMQKKEITLWNNGNL